MVVDVVIVTRVKISNKSNISDNFSFNNCKERTKKGVGFVGWHWLFFVGGGFEDTGGAVAMLLLMGSMGSATEVAYGELTIDN